MYCNKLEKKKLTSLHTENSQNIYTNTFETKNINLQTKNSQNNFQHDIYCNKLESTNRKSTRSKNRKFIIPIPYKFIIRINKYKFPKNKKFPPNIENFSFHF